MENLWPNIDIKTEENSLTSFLREQGKYLEEMTNNILSYEIETSIVFSQDRTTKQRYETRFYIHAPLLDGYSFLLFWVLQDFNGIYPLEIKYHTYYHKINNEKELVKGLKTILGSSYVQNVIKTLYFRSKENETAEFIK